MAVAQGRRLRYLIALVEVLGGVAFLGAVAHRWTVDESAVSWVVAAYVAITLVSASTTIDVRFGAGRIALSWSDTVILLGLITLPRDIVVIVSALATLAVKSARRVGTTKAVYNAAKVAIAATGAAVALELVQVGPVDPLTGHRILGLLAAYACYVLISDATVSAVIGLSAGRSIWTVFSADWQVRIVQAICNVAFAFGMAALLAVDKLLVLAIPPFAIALKMTYTSYLRARTERESWQRIAEICRRIVRCGALRRSQEPARVSRHVCDPISPGVHSCRRFRGNVFRAHVHGNVRRA